MFTYQGIGPWARWQGKALHWSSCPAEQHLHLFSSLGRAVKESTEYRARPPRFQRNKLSLFGKRRDCHALVKSSRAAPVLSSISEETSCTVVRLVLQNQASNSQKTLPRNVHTFLSRSFCSPWRLTTLGRRYSVCSQREWQT